MYNIQGKMALEKEIESTSQRCMKIEKYMMRLLKSHDNIIKSSWNGSLKISSLEC